MKFLHMLEFNIFNYFNYFQCGFRVFMYHQEYFEPARKIIWTNAI